MADPDPLVQQIALRVKRERRRKHLTQDQAAGLMGVHANTYRKLEQGKDVRLLTFLKVCTALDIPLDLSSPTGSWGKTAT